MIDYRLPMSFPSLDGQELIAWVERTSVRWQELLTAHPEALTFPCDIRETSDIAGLLKHVVAVELRYAERLCDLPPTAYDTIACETADAAYLVHRRATGLLATLGPNDDAWWRASIEFTLRNGGTMQASRRMIFIHSLMHSIRHYAQMATIIRQHGVAAAWPMDYLGMQS